MPAAVLVVALGAGLGGHRPQPAGRAARRAPRSPSSRALVAASPAWFTPRAPGGRTRDHLRARVGAVCRRRRSQPPRRHARDPRGRARPRRRPHRQRQVDAAAHHQRARPALQRRHADGRVTVDGLDTAEHRPRDLATVVGLVEQNPIVDLRHGRRRGRGRLRHGDDGPGLDGDPPPRRGDPRPLRPHAAARAVRSRPLGWPAAARRDRRALRRRPAGARARRADLGAGSRCRRRGPGLAPPHRARPRGHGRAGRAPARARRPPRRPRRPRRRGARVRAARPRRGDAALADLPTRRRALPPRRMVADAAVDPRRPPQGGRPARCPRRQHAAPRGRPARHRARRRRRRSPASGSRAAAGSSLDGVDLDRGPRLGDDADGPQRRRQVDPARRHRGAAPARRRASARRGRGLDPHARARASGSAPSGSCPQQPELLLYADSRRGRVRRGATTTSRRRPARLAPCSTASPGGIDPHRAPARPVRGPAARARARRHPRRVPRGAAARRADARPRLRRQEAARRGAHRPRGPGARRSCSPPTTSSWRPRSPTASSSSPTARSSPTAPPARSSRLAGLRPAGDQGAAPPDLAHRRRGRRCARRE